MLEGGVSGALCTLARLILVCVAGGVVYLRGIPTRSWRKHEANEAHPDATLVALSILIVHLAHAEVRLRLPKAPTRRRSPVAASFFFQGVYVAHLLRVFAFTREDERFCSVHGIAFALSASFWLYVLYRFGQSWCVRCETLAVAFFLEKRSDIFPYELAVRDFCGHQTHARDLGWIVPIAAVGVGTIVCPPAAAVAGLPAAAGGYLQAARVATLFGSLLFRGDNNDGQRADKSFSTP